MIGDPDISVGSPNDRGHELELELAAMPSTTPRKAFEAFSHTAEFKRCVRDAQVRARTEMALWRAVYSCFRIAQAAARSHNRKSSRDS